MSHKVAHLEQKVATTYSITRKVGIAFQYRTQVIMKINKSNVIEDLIMEFLNDTKDYEKTKENTKGNIKGNTERTAKGKRN